MKLKAASERPRRSGGEVTDQARAEDHVLSKSRADSSISERLAEMKKN